MTDSVSLCDWLYVIERFLDDVEIFRSSIHVGIIEKLVAIAYEAEYSATNTASMAPGVLKTALQIYLCLDTLNQRSGFVEILSNRHSKVS